MYDFTVIGGGIVGLSALIALREKYPQASLLLLEKEQEVGTHQTGHNSGVIHSGIYYKPGSLKAKLCRDGNRSMVEFCQQHDITYETCGKVIVATEERELPVLETIYKRGLENGLNVEKIDGDSVREIEPHVRCLAGIRVPSTGIVDYKKVSQKYAQLAKERGAELRFNTKVEKILDNSQGQVLETDRGEFITRFVINCAGLYSDRIAKRGRVDPQAKIVPFRGEYYELKPEKRYLVKHLIYPVPHPDFPFLGVHFTRIIDGSIHAGPNAVLSLKREGYKKTDFSLIDVGEVITYPGFWKLASNYAAEGLKEMIRSWSKVAFVRSLQKLIPEVRSPDIIPTQAGVRAQALKPDGLLVDDFLIVPGKNAIHVCNAPSPAATASLEIGKAIASYISTNSS